MRKTDDKKGTFKKGQPLSQAKLDAQLSSIIADLVEQDKKNPLSPKPSPPQKSGPWQNKAKTEKPVKPAGRPATSMTFRKGAIKPNPWASKPATEKSATRAPTSAVLNTPEKKEKRSKLQIFGKIVSTAPMLAAGALVIASYVMPPLQEEGLSPEELDRRHVIITAMENTDPSSPTVSQYCLRSGAFISQDMYDSELSIYQKALYQLEHGKKTSQIGNALIKSNAEHGVLRCFFDGTENQGGRWLPELNILSINMNYYSPSDILYGGNTYRDALSSDIEESVHAYQFTEHDPRPLMNAKDRMDRFLSWQAVEGHAKVIKTLALGEMYGPPTNWESANAIIGDESGSSNKTRAHASLCAPLAENNTSTSACLTQAFNAFTQSKSPYTQYHVEYSETSSYLFPPSFNEAAFVEIFGDIPGHPGKNFLRGNFNRSAVYDDRGNAVSTAVEKHIRAMGGGEELKGNYRPNSSGIKIGS